MKNEGKINKIFIGLIAILLIGYIPLGIMIYNSNKYEPEDVNKDGKVDALDLLIVQKHILKELEDKE